MAHYSKPWWFSNNTGTLAKNQRAIVFGPGDVNTVATIYADAGLTTPLANPTVTNPTTGVLSFYVPDDSGIYYIFVGAQATGDSEEWNSSGTSGGTVLSVNGVGPDGAGNVQLTPGNVGADPAGAAAAAAAASQPIATINAKGDLYAGTGNDATTRLPVGANGLALVADSSTPTGLVWQAFPAAPVLSVNGATGVVVLTAASVGADASGSATAAFNAAVALSLQKASNLSDLANPGTARGNLGLGGSAVLNVGTGAGTVAAGDDTRIVGAQQRSTLTTKGDLYAATASGVTTRVAVGADGAVLFADSAQPTGLSWGTLPAAPVLSVNAQTGNVVLTAGQVGAIAVALVDAKGDLVTATANDAPARLPVGTDGQFLRASSAAGTGLVWDTVTPDEVGAVASVLTANVVYGTTTAGAVLNRQVSAAASASSVAVRTAEQQIRSTTVVDGDVNADPTDLTSRTYVASATVQVPLFTDDRNVLTTSVGLARWYNRTGFDLVITGCWASAGIVPTGASLIVDVDLNGTTIYSTQANRPTIPISGNGGAVTVPNTTAFPQGSYLTVDIDQVGSTIPGGMLTVGVVARRAG